MTTFAPGTPKSVMDEVNRKWMERQTTMTPSDGRMVPAVAGQGGGGLTGIRDAASGLIGTAQNVSQMSQSLVGGPSGMSEIGQPRNAIFKKGGKVKVSSASKRADGIAQRGKTKGRMV